MYIKSELTYVDNKDNDIKIIIDREFEEGESRINYLNSLALLLGILEPDQILSVVSPMTPSDENEFWAAHGK